MIALHAERYVRVGDTHQCLDCGQIVTNRADHNRVHERLERQVVSEIMDRVDDVLPEAKRA